MSSPHDVIYRIEGRTLAHGLLVCALALALGYFTTGAYVAALGIDYLESGNQYLRHLAIIKGHGGDPWQYRMLAPYLLKSVIALNEWLAVSQPHARAFIYFRHWQDVCVLVTAYVYYRHLDLSAPAALLGMGLLAWGMAHSNFDSDLQFSTFFDVLFYLLAGLCIVRGWWRWLVPLTVLAALNRESSGFMPLLLLAAAHVATPASRWREALPTVALALACYVGVFLGLRLLYGAQDLMLPYGHKPGLDILAYNLLRSVTFEQMLATLGVTPLVAALGYRQWPATLRAFFWTLVPLWLVIHAGMAVLAETRLLLVPQALVLIPAALFACGFKPAAEPAPAPARRSARKRQPRLEVGE
ncbi:MAG: hypothetical protein IT492_22040 [Gammaproteobacteria bacterium]|nr:hypothetical protein [Gammaproteobacteria bacterium]